MKFWNYIKFLSLCHQPRSSISIHLEMTSKTRLLLQMQNGRKITFYFLSVTALSKTSFFIHFRNFLLLMWCQVVVMSFPYSVSCPYPMSCPILLWRRLQRRKHTLLPMGLKNLLSSCEGRSCHSTSKYLYKSVSKWLLKYIHVHKTQRKSLMCLIDVFWMIWWI